ncbi:MAG TPA: hypothetical protein VGI39_06285 [Polyangiaceae bacterium]
MLALVGCTAPVPPHALPVAPPPRELFAFHVDFWPNLSESLFHESLLPRPGFQGPKSLAQKDVAAASALEGDERTAWQRALSYYDGHFSTRTTFEPLFDGGSRFFASSGSAPALASGSLPEDWRAVLTGAAPAYRAHFWPEHERRDRAYVAALAPALAAHGDWMARRLEAVYQTPWPAAPVVVEVTAAAAPFGARTTGEPPFTGTHAPLITVSSEDPGYAGDTGLEMIFHEVSHLLVDKVQAALEDSAKRQGRSLDKDLWHALVFYTAGALTRERLGPAYVPYSDRPEHSVFSGRWSRYGAVFVQAWQPYLDGRVGLEAAVDAVVAAL